MTSIQWANVIIWGGLAIGWLALSLQTMARKGMVSTIDHSLVQFFAALASAVVVLIVLVRAQ